MRQVRNGVFETNSSSMHSLSISKHGTYGTLPVDEFENKVITHFGEFGWGYDTYRDPETKLSYLVTMLVETNGDCYSIEELCETEEFQEINSVIAEYCNCDGILIDEKIEQANYDGKYYEWNEHTGYIDHQSVIGIHGLLDYYDCTLEEFIFDEGVVLIIDNDNH